MMKPIKRLESESDGTAYDAYPPFPTSPSPFPPPPPPSETQLAALLRGCPAVRHFLFASRSTVPIHGLTDSLLWQLAKKWPLLESLAFNAGLMSENGVFAISDCKHLKSLALHGYRRWVPDKRAD